MSPLFDQLGLGQIDPHVRLALAHEIIGSVITPVVAPALSPAQLAELQRRVEDDDANPDDVIPADEVHAELLARFKS